jgi:hypothetical protein
MMTLNRYLLIGQDHAAWLVLFAKMDFKWVIRGSFLISVLLTIGHGWEYQAIDDSLFSPLNSNFYTWFDGLLSTSGDAVFVNYPIPNFSQAFYVYTVVYFVINFLLFFVLNTLIEVMLVVRMRKEMRDKRKRLATMQHAPNNVSQTIIRSNQEDKKKKQEEEDWKKERRVIIMVVLNGVLNFVLRVPDLLVLLEEHGFWAQLINKAHLQFVSFGIFIPALLDLFVAIGYFTYILTFTTNFLVFYFFNSKFKAFVVFSSRSKNND